MDRVGIGFLGLSALCGAASYKLKDLQRRVAALTSAAFAVGGLGLFFTRKKESAGWSVAMGETPLMAQKGEASEIKCEFFYNGVSLTVNRILVGIRVTFIRHDQLSIDSYWKDCEKVIYFATNLVEGQTGSFPEKGKVSWVENQGDDVSVINILQASS